ncbi:hypothetical protein ACFE04_031022 [Oxalis oulophora]
MVKLRETVLERRAGVEIESYHGIPRLPYMAEIDSNDAIIEITVTNLDGLNITFAINVTSLYVVGFRTDNVVLFLSDFQRTNIRTEFLGGLTRLVEEKDEIDGNYESLHNKAGTDRLTMLMGFNEMDARIRNIYFGNSELQKNSGYRVLLIAITVFAEAARFAGIERAVTRNIIALGAFSSFQFEEHPLEAALTNSWGALSNFVRQADADTQLFPAPFSFLTLSSPNEYDGVPAVKTELKLEILTSTCRNPIPHQIQNQLQIEKQVEEGHDYCITKVKTFSYIVGIDNVCVDVVNENSIVASNTCSTTWKYIDQKIKINMPIVHGEKCITSRGNELILGDCTDDPANILWELRENGIVANRGSNRVWTMYESSNEIGLEENIMTTDQAWFFVVNRVVPELIIQHYNGFCLSVVGDTSVGLGLCDPVNEDLIWSVSRNGVILNKRTGLCLINRQNIVIIDVCSGYEEERWIIYEHDTIKSLTNTFAITVVEFSSQLVAKPIDMNGRWTVINAQQWYFHQH